MVRLPRRRELGVPWCQLVLSTERAGEVGFLKLHKWEHPRPALAHALLQKGGRRLLASQVKRFADDRKIGAGDSREKALLEKTLAGHPDQAQLLANWSPRPTRKRQQTKVAGSAGEDGEGSSSESEEEAEEDDDHDWMTAAALAANPDDHEFQNLRARFAQKELAKKVDEAVETMLRKTGARGEPALDRAAVEEETSRTDQEEPPTTGLDASGGAAPRDIRGETSNVR